MCSQKEVGSGPEGFEVCSRFSEKVFKTDRERLRDEDSNSKTDWERERLRNGDSNSKTDWERDRKRLRFLEIEPLASILRDKIHHQ